MKKLNKLIIIFFIITVLSILITNNIYATDSVIQGAKNFLKVGDEQTLDVGQIKGVSDDLFNTFVAVGSVIVVIVGAAIGVKFIIGSTEEKAEMKETLIPYIVGAAIIFGAYGIWNALVGVFKNF